MCSSGDDTTCSRTEGADCLRCEIIGTSVLGTDAGTGSAPEQYVRPRISIAIDIDRTVLDIYASGTRPYARHRPHMIIPPPGREWNLHQYRLLPSVRQPNPMRFTQWDGIGVS